MDFNNFEGNYKPRHRPRRPYLLLLILLSISIAIIFLIFHSSSPTPPPPPQKLTFLEFRNESVTLDDVLSGKFYAKNFNGSFSDPHNLQYFSSSGDFMLFSMETGQSRVIVSADEFHALLPSHRPFRCDFSPSRKFLLIGHDPQKVFRHSVVALYSVLELEGRKLTHISDNKNDESRLQLAQWSKTKDALVFVHDNDVYLLPSIQGDAERVSFSGAHYVSNGVTDWVYEEEMFNSNVAVWLHDDTTLAFVTFNDSLVDLIQFPIYGGFQYPVIEGIPYPKSGRTNPTAVISIYANKMSRPLQLPSYIPAEHYVGSVQWTAERNLMVQILNRYQNNSWVLLCDGNAVCDVVHTQEQSKGWLDVSPIFQFSNSNFVTIETTKQASRSYKHLIQFSKNSVVKVMSKGDFSVDKILAVEGEDVYYTSNGNLYKLGTPKPQCITCELTCATNQVTMDPSSGRYFTHVCLNGLGGVPVVSIYATSPLLLLTTLETNTGLSKTMATIQIPKEKSLSFVSSNYTIQIKLLLPFDLDEGKKYPLLIDVYGGPSSTRINNKFNIDWGVSMVSSGNIIYGFIDGRGSGGQSDDFMFEIYKKFGSVEVEDQIRGVEHILQTLPYVDKAKVAIWGWSYGGFVTSMVMGKDLGNIFKCGISVAPVTNWGFYDTIYTERYMGLPQENLRCYNDSDVTNHLENFRHKQFLLIHGNADDNVHYQQSMYLSRALELADILFYQQSYPDENHGLGSVRPHLYHSIQHFLSSCFSG